MASPAEPSLGLLRRTCMSLTAPRAAAVLLALLVAGCRPATAAVSAVTPSPPSASPSPVVAPTAAAVPTAGTRIAGPAGQRDATSGGRLVSATGMLQLSGFGLVAPTAGLAPRRTAAAAYARLSSPDFVAPPAVGTGPVITLAMATMAFSKPSHDALVWVFVWPNQQCISAGAEIDNSLFPQASPVPTSQPCSSYVLMSDTTGKVVTAGDG